MSIVFTFELNHEAAKQKMKRNRIFLAYPNPTIEVLILRNFLASLLLLPIPNPLWAALSDSTGPVYGRAPYLDTLVEIPGDVILINPYDNSNIKDGAVIPPETKPAEITTLADATILETMKAGDLDGDCAQNDAPCTILPDVNGLALTWKSDGTTLSEEELSGNLTRWSGLTLTIEPTLSLIVSSPTGIPAEGRGLAVMRPLSVLVAPPKMTHTFPGKGLLDGTSNLPSSGFTGASYSINMDEQIDVANYTWTVDKTWVSIDGNTVTFTGRPERGDGTYTLTAVDNRTGANFSVTNTIYAWYGFLPNLKIGQVTTACENAGYDSQVSSVKMFESLDGHHWILPDAEWGAVAADWGAILNYGVNGTNYWTKSSVTPLGSRFTHTYERLFMLAKGNVDKGKYTYIVRESEVDQYQVQVICQTAL